MHSLDRHALEPLHRHEAQEGVDEVNDPHDRITAAIKDTAPAFGSETNEGNQPRRAEDKYNEDGHGGNDKQTPQIVYASEHTIVAVKLEDLHSQEREEPPDRYDSGHLTSMLLTKAEDT